MSNLKRSALTLLCLVALFRTAACTPLHEDVTDGGAGVAADGGMDADAEAVIEAAPPAGPQGDFYVDPNAAPPAFKTITEAAKAAALSAAPKRTIHVAAGTYSATTGEAFPIELRGVSLVGAGSSLTIVAGKGIAPATIAPPTVLPTDPVSATLLVGDPSVAVTLAHLTIFASVSGNPVPEIGTEAIICDRGNVSGPGTAVANTTIDDVTVDGFDIGLRVTVSRIGASLSGCSALVRASTFQNGAFGVFSEGALNGETPSQFVAIQLGDGSPNGGSVFRNFHIDTARGDLLHNGGALISRSAVTGITAIGNRFSASDFGMELYDKEGGDPSPGAVIVENDFGTMSNAGLMLLSHVAVARLESNLFHDITTGDHPDPSWVGVGVSLDDYYTDTLPIVRHARGNTFFGNDLGLAIRVSTFASLTTENLSDFGTANDLGGNSFRCNGVGPRTYPRNGGKPGGDVIVAIHTPSDVTIPLEGNTWDHPEPTLSPPAPFVSGIDMGIDMGTVTNVKVDTANAQTASSPACPTGIPIGP